MGSAPSPRTPRAQPGGGGEAADRPVPQVLALGRAVATPAFALGREALPVPRVREEVRPQRPPVQARQGAPLPAQQPAAAALTRPRPHFNHIFKKGPGSNSPFLLGSQLKPRCRHSSCYCQAKSTREVKVTLLPLGLHSGYTLCPGAVNIYYFCSPGTHSFLFFKSK